eukprot:scaffold4081_cov268-Pinguiococcus_pyrenoidosus.AAC.7
MEKRTLRRGTNRAEAGRIPAALPKLGSGVDAHAIDNRRHEHRHPFQGRGDTQGILAVAHFLASGPRVDHRHAVLGQRARLVAADVGRVAHGLTGRELSDQVHIFHHLAGAVRKADRDGKRKTLRHGDDHDGHG